MGRILLAQTRLEGQSRTGHFAPLGSEDFPQFSNQQELSNCMMPAMLTKSEPLLRTTVEARYSKSNTEAQVNERQEP